MYLSSPQTTAILNIFEPRYRAMYNDILFNGARVIPASCCEVTTVYTSFSEDFSSVKYRTT